MILPGEQTVLVLQGGGALGAYQAGAYEGLTEAGIEPEWVAGISIGAINGSLIAGNRPENRLSRLRQFWDRVTDGLARHPFGTGEVRTALNELNALGVSLFGVPGLFAPRVVPALLAQPGSRDAMSVYSTAPLLTTLTELVDFEVLNSGAVRYSAGSVSVTSGNFAYFDTQQHRIGPEHVMASAALPPGFPPIEIGGEPFWDGGLVSNTPLQYVLEYTGKRSDMCIFQLDLFSARGVVPKSLLGVAAREKEIRYSSRTRLNTDEFMKRQKLRAAYSRLLTKLPPELLRDPDVAFLAEHSCDAAVTIVHLIYRSEADEGPSMDYDFSRWSMEEHWQAGRRDVRRTLDDRRWRDRIRPTEGVEIFDLTDGSREKTAPDERSSRE
jgi:NTE family protein